MRRLSQARAYLTLFVAVVFVSTAGPFLAAAHMDTYAVVFWRLAATALILLGWARFGGALVITRAQLREVALGSALLTAHFLLWIKAFDLTDYASNLLLLVAQPAIAAVAGRWLGEPSGRHTWASVGIALAGLLVITRGDFALGWRAILGDLFCVLAGVAITGFYVVTRRTRSALPMPVFLGVTSAIGAVLTVPFLWLSDAPLLAYEPNQWGWLAGLILVTTIGGHGLYNIAARHLSLFTVNIVIVIEPVIGIWLGAMISGVRVTGTQLVGGVILGLAVVIGLLPALRPKARPAQ